MEEVIDQNGMKLLLSMQKQWENLKQKLSQDP
jgi:hypothetical protein